MTTRCLVLYKQKLSTERQRLVPLILECLNVTSFETNSTRPLSWDDVAKM